MSRTLRRIDDMDQVHIRRIDVMMLVGQGRLAPVDERLPECPAHQDHRDVRGIFPVWIRVTISVNSSNVPKPPGM